MDEGYIKYQSFWEEQDAIPKGSIDDINHYRQLLYEQRLIGYDEEHQVAYGNISKRVDLNHFFITGTQTGGIPVLEEKHYSKVIFCDLENNRLYCIGKARASSEAMTHFMVYSLANSFKAVIHIHHFKMWSVLKDSLPTSSPNVPYGTPEMAIEVNRLYSETNLSESRIMIMAGHKEGILVFGETLEETYQTLMNHFDEFRNEA